MVGLLPRAQDHVSCVFNPLKLLKFFVFLFLPHGQFQWLFAREHHGTVHVCTYIKYTRGWESAQNARKIDAYTSGNAFTKLRGRQHCMYGVSGGPSRRKQN